MDKESALITVILVNYNGLNDTADAIKSLYKAFGFLDIIVVDNCSRNDEAKKIKQMFSSIKVIYSEKNLGFAGGNNLGIQYALKTGADYIMLLNNDTVVDKDMIKIMLQNISDDTLVVPKMLYYSRPNKIWYGGGNINRKLGHSFHIDVNQEETRASIKKPQYCTFATGCCIMASKRIFEVLNGFDESYFMYCEDTDFCIRLLKHGFKILYLPDAKLWHKVGSSSGGEESPLSNYYITRNRLLCLKKHKDYFEPTAFWYSLVSRYIRMIQYALKKKEWKIFYMALEDARKGIVGKRAGI